MNHIIEGSINKINIETTEYLRYSWMNLIKSAIFEVDVGIFIQAIGW